MTEKEVLGLEKDNYTTIHLYLVGIPIKSSILKNCIMIYVWNDIKKGWEEYKYGM